MGVVRPRIRERIVREGALVRSLAVLLVLPAQRAHELRLARLGVFLIVVVTRAVGVAAGRGTAAVVNGRSTMAGTGACRQGFRYGAASAACIVASTLANDVRLHADGTRRAVKLVAVGSNTSDMILVQGIWVILTRGRIYRMCEKKKKRRGIMFVISVDDVDRRIAYGLALVVLTPERCCSGVAVVALRCVRGCREIVDRAAATYSVRTNHFLRFLTRRTPCATLAVVVAHALRTRTLVLLTEVSSTRSITRKGDGYSQACSRVHMCCS